MRISISPRLTSISSDATKAMQLADAAPDLLAALKRVTYFASFTDDLRITARVIGGTTEAAENYIKRADEQDNAVKAAKAIIAKAEGGASRGGATAS